ncbi:transcriptional regulator [Delftia tsuruhatensis]|uniref:transcriptional regulator n=1 Tax=Delftia tsuruhatensis TaxID=180282 RepID=UPI002443E21C|nr:transcriptional regulator [Delftia tsuruhatensis]MDH0776359.1 transcriptional regulator [Delftia tsuruhatensis]MDH1460086.1 transcriptional regulator [Delftia tsuruhatensis]MDH1823049.1 transcriptional regulator [Delftia tsuruhatensis]WGG12255.1 transcriptional regulator [Delftia tsuruhatensis]
MNMQIRVIKTPQEHEAAIARLSSLMDLDIQPDSEEEAELELLSVVIESYERDQAQPISLDPVEVVLFYMDQRGLSRNDMVPYFGSISKVSDVLSRKRPLSLAMIRKLHQGLGISADMLVNESLHEGFDADAEPTVDFEKLPFKEMVDRRHFRGVVKGIKDFKERAEEVLRVCLPEVFGMRSSPARLRATLAQKGQRIMDSHALLVWQAGVIHKARELKIEGKYQRDTITKDWLRELAKLSSFDKGPLLAQEYLNKAGIALVFEEHYKKTYLDGAAMLDGQLPVVGLTLRYDRLDNFWFALLHELVHIGQHLGPNNTFIADNLDDKQRADEDIEQEADRGAQDALIPPDVWAIAETRTAPTTENVLALAKSLRISPTIVAGRVRREKQNYRLLSNINQPVRHFFADQLSMS